MTLEQLWNGWRAQYIASAQSSNPRASTSVFTQILESGLSDIESNIVHRGQTVFAILNAFPYSTGHILVLPYREVTDLEDLDLAESAELWATVTQSVRVLKVSHRPDAVNVGINLGATAGGSISEHLHVHVVPRWNGDSNFMTSVANARTLPEPLADTARKIRAAWSI
ncbi:MAG: HIT domain-containing protein [Ilumatobacteraceae bacterium]|nr:HIT domain-containing protein [Ilumatobacteraceae bacterium]